MASDFEMVSELSFGAGCMRSSFYPHKLLKGDEQVPVDNGKSFEYTRL
jgi:hypothetical protein